MTRPVQGNNRSIFQKLGGLLSTIKAAIRNFGRGRLRTPAADLRPQTDQTPLRFSKTPPAAPGPTLQPDGTWEPVPPPRIRKQAKPAPTVHQAPHASDDRYQDRGRYSVSTLCDDDGNPVRPERQAEPARIARVNTWNRGNLFESCSKHVPADPVTSREQDREQSESFATQNEELTSSPKEHKPVAQMTEGEKRALKDSVDKATERRTYEPSSSRDSLERAADAFLAASPDELPKDESFEAFRAGLEDDPLDEFRQNASFAALNEELGSNPRVQKPVDQMTEGERKDLERSFDDAAGKEGPKS